MPACSHLWQQVAAATLPRCPSAKPPPLLPLPPELLGMPQRNASDTVCLVTHCLGTHQMHIDCQRTATPAQHKCCLTLAWRAAYCCMDPMLVWLPALQALQGICSDCCWLAALLTMHTCMQKQSITSKTLCKLWTGLSPGLVHQVLSDTAGYGRQTT